MAVLSFIQMDMHDFTLNTVRSVVNIEEIMVETEAYLLIQSS